jgi:DNA primase
VTYAVDFAELKAKIPITDALAFLGINHLAQSGDTLRGTCPFCKVTNPRGFVVTPAKGTWYCFSEKKGGDIIRLAAVHGRTDDKAAAQKLAAHFLKGAGKPADNDPAPTDGAPERKSAGFDPVEYQRSLVPDHPALKELPFTSQTIRDFDGGYCAKGLNRGRLTLPVHNPTGELLAFMGLALGTEQPDITYPKGFTPPLFFNLHRVGRGSTLTLVSTPMDVLRAWDHSLQDVVCPLTPVTPDSLDFLAKFMREKERDVLDFY